MAFPSQLNKALYKCIILSFIALFLQSLCTPPTQHFGIWPWLYSQSFHSVLQNPENVAVVGRLSVAWLPSDPLLQNADPWIFGYKRLAGVPGLYLSSVWYVPCMFRTALRWGQCYTCLYIHVILFIFHASGDYYRGEDLYCTLKKAITFSESMVFELQLKRISLLFQMLNLICTCYFLPFRWDCMCK